MVDVAILVLPVGATALSVSRAGRALSRGLVNWSRGSAPRRLAAAMFAAALIGGIGYLWWPNGDYQPIRPGEQGTIGDALAGMAEVRGGRPSFTPEDERRFGAVPTVRDTEATRRAEQRGEVPPGTAERELRRGQRWLLPDDSGDVGAPWDYPADPVAPDDGSDGTYVWPTAPGDTTTQPGGTTTEPGGTTTEPAPTETAPDSTGTGTTPTETAPDSTGTETAPTETAPDSTGTETVPTETTPTDTVPLNGDTSTTDQTTTGSGDTTTTAPDSTTTSPAP